MVEPIHLLKADDYRLNISLSEVNLGRPEAMIIMQAIDKMQLQGMVVIGHFVTAKPDKLAGILTPQEIDAIRGMLKTEHGIEENSRSPSWRAPAHSFMCL